MGRHGPSPNQLPHLPPPPVLGVHSPDERLRPIGHDPHRRPGREDAGPVRIGLAGGAVPDHQLHQRHEAPRRGGEVQPGGQLRLDAGVEGADADDLHHAVDVAGRVQAESDQST